MKTLNKGHIRALLLKRRRSLSEEEYRSQSERIVEGIRSLDAFLHSENPVLFCPFDREPDITPLFSFLLSTKGFLILPKVKDDHIELYRVNTTEDLKPQSFCILEPSEGERVSPEEVDFILVPGVAFDRRGYRLGFGKGYYDRLLVNIKGLKVGVCYSFQVLEEIPTDPWDVPVDMIVTEKFVIKGGKKP